MSRLKERQEKNCLNCFKEVAGRYCQHCGQENIETKESVWDLVSHFFKDITHFDGKFFSTLKFLFARPGFLPMEYMVGRRASYVNPVRMYVFTSAFFFLIFFSFISITKVSIKENADILINGKTFEQVEKMDSMEFRGYVQGLKKIYKTVSPDITREEVKRRFDSTFLQKDSITFTNIMYETKSAYDSALMSGAVKDGWFERMLTYKWIELNDKYNGQGGRLVADYLNKLLHSLPQMLFVLLPFFALVLKLLYIKRKEYYYVNHGIFTIHFYIFSFLIMLVIFSLSKLNGLLNWSVIPIIEFVMVLGIYFYLYKAMRKFYRQRRAKTVFKYLLLNLMILLLIAILIFIYGIYSFYKL